MSPDFVIIDDRFADLLLKDAWVERVFTGSIWAEGPVYFRNGDYVLWSDIPNNRMLRWSSADGGSVFREPSNFTNGHTLDRQGRLVSCEHGGRRVSRTSKDGTYEVLVDRFEGRRLNSPNDVVVKSDGSVWFTDPSYGILSDWEGFAGEMEYGACYVFRFDPADGSLSVISDHFAKPNGLAFSPDERILYVADTEASHNPAGRRDIWAFDVTADGRGVENGRRFAVCDSGLFDGFRIDVEGNVWTSAGDGVHVYTPEPEAKKIGAIRIPERAVANVVFGGPDGNILYVAATTSLYRVELGVAGIQPC
ncbi:MAG: SMP-30/gluconolactonase/LRE family protein [Alphaproteobacteria bacterium]